MRGSEEGAASSPVTLGLADEVERRTGACPPRHVYDTSGTPIQVEWLPQRYSQMGKRRLRLLLAVIALAALVMPMRRRQPPVCALASPSLLLLFARIPVRALAGCSSGSPRRPSRPLRSRCS